MVLDLNVRGAGLVRASLDPVIQVAGFRTRWLLRYNNNHDNGGLPASY